MIEIQTLILYIYTMDFSEYESTHPFLVFLWRNWIHEKYSEYKKARKLCTLALEKSKNITDEEVKQVFLYCYMQTILKQ